MSPIERWNQLASPDRLNLPVELDELEIVCCDVIERTITHEGVEWNSTMFQSAALQQLRRRIPASLGFRVQVRHSGHMARIWVRDPTDETDLEVLNADPATKDLTVPQARELHLVQGRANSANRLTAAEGRKRLRDWSRQLIECKNIRAKRALLRLMNLLPNDQEVGGSAAPTELDAATSAPTRKPSKPSKPPKAAKAAKPRAASAATLNDSPGSFSVPQRPDQSTNDEAPLFKAKRTDRLGCQAKEEA